MVSSRDRSFVSVEMAWLGPSPEHRRLRFSFQINDVKDLDRVSPTPLFSAGGRRRRLSIEPPRRGQSGPFGLFRRTSRNPWGPKNWAQKPHRAAEGQPSLVGGDSIGARENTHPGAKIKGNFAPFRSPLQGPRPSGRRLSSGLAGACQRSSCDGAHFTHSPHRRARLPAPPARL